MSATDVPSGQTNGATSLSSISGRPVNSTTQNGHSSSALQDGNSVLSDPARLAALERSQLLDTPPEEAFDRLTRMAARLLGVPVALVSLVDDKRQFFKSAVGLSGETAETRATPLSHSYCQHVVNSGTKLVVEDARQHPLLKDNPAVLDNAIAYCGVPIVDPAGRTLGTLCVLDHAPRPWTEEQIRDLQDLAASVTAEVRLRFLALDLVDANTSLRDVIATASHDVRSPLAVIKGYAGLLADDDDVPSEERKEFAGHILSAASQAHVLVTDLLQVGRLEAGAVEPKPAVIALSSAVKSVVNQNRMEGFDDVLITVPNDLLTFVDPSHLTRILTNLIGNAVKYAGTLIHVDATARDEMAILTVSDSGSGVPTEFVPRLFEKFARGEDASKVAPEGAGLGLPIVAGLAEANGGEARYEPNSPNGSRFIVELPLAPHEH